MPINHTTSADRGLWFGSTTFGHWTFSVWLFVFSVAANILLLAMPLYLSQIYDRVLPSSSHETLLYLTIFMVFCLALFGLFETLRNKVGQKFSVYYELGTAPKILGYAVRAKSVDAKKQASLLHDISSVRQVLSSRAYISLFDLPFAPLFLAILFMVHPWIGALALVGAFLLIAIAFGNEFVARNGQAKTSQFYGEAAANSNEILSRLDDVKAMGMGQTLQGRWWSSALNAANSSNDVAGVNGFFFGLVRFARQAIQIGILGCGAYLVLTENLSAGLIFASSIVAGRALMPIEQLIGSWRQLASARAAHKRVKTSIASLNKDIASQSYPVELPSVEGQISCNAVCVVPEGMGEDKALINNITFRAIPGEVVAVVGPSGAGKTTLLRVLANIIKPTSGELSFDGFEAGQWDPEQLGANIGYAGQESDFFRGTISENIARFNPTATDEEVIAAAKLAGAHEFIGTLPNGYNTPLNNGNFRLSGGQKQRINLARAFFRDPPILLLDEPDAHLDQNGEVALKKAMVGAKQRGKTVLFVTHKMNMVSSADKAMILRGGVIDKFGPKEEVFKPRPQDAKGGKKKPISKAKQGWGMSKPAKLVRPTGEEK